MSQVQTIPSSELQGDLEITPPAQALLQLRDLRLTGRATFVCQQHKIDLSLLEGNIMHVAANDPDRRLGEVLLRDGRIRLKDYIDSVDALLETGERQGTFLLENGRLEKNELKKAVREHMRELVFWLLTWQEGSYLFRDAPPSDEDIQLHLSTNELILRGLAQRDQYSVLRDTLAPWHRICRINSDIDPHEAKRIRLKEDEAAIIRLIDGTQTIHSVVKNAPMADFRAMQLLYALTWAQIIELDDAEL